MADHTSNAFDAELKTLRDGIVKMGDRAQKMVLDAMEALASGNLDLAREILAAETHITDMQRHLAENAIHTIARRQPLAVDLREIIGAIRISSDLEGVGDLAKNIALRAKDITGAANVQRGALGLKLMCGRVAKQLKNALDAYEHRDVELATAAWRRDSRLDALEDSAFRDLLTFMMEDPGSVPLCTQLLFCAKNLDRVSDHAANIAEVVVFVVAGEKVLPPADELRDFANPF